MNIYTKIFIYIYIHLPMMQLQYGMKTLCKLANCALALLCLPFLCFVLMWFALMCLLAVCLPSFLHLYASNMYTWQLVIMLLV